MNSTMLAIESLLAADSSIDEEQKEAILKACRQKRKRRRLGTIRDASAILNVHPITIRRYVAKGLLHPIHINARRIRYDLDEVEQLLNYGSGQQ